MTQVSKTKLHVSCVYESLEPDDDKCQLVLRDLIYKHSQSESGVKFHHKYISMSYHNNGWLY